MSGNSKLVTSPSEEPVTVDELKTYLRLDTHDDNTLLKTLITAAREHVENETRRALITQTWALFLDQFPRNHVTEWWDGVREGPVTGDVTSSIELPYGPLVSITHLKTYDESDSPTTFSSSSYYTDTASIPGKLALRSGYAWPSFTRAKNGIEIEYVAGYGAANDVPAAIRNTIQSIALDWYENRGSVVVGTISSRISGPVDHVLEKYRIHRL